MRLIWKIGALIGAMLLAVVPSTVSGQRLLPDQQVSDPLYSQEQQLANAEKNKDRNYFKRKLDKDLIYVASDGLVFTKPKILESLTYIDVSRYSIKNMKIRALGADAGLVTYDLLLSGKIAGRNLPAKQYASSVWVKHDGNWVLMFHQTTPAHHN